MKLWMRLGVFLRVSDAEANVILGDDEAASNNAIMKAVEEGRFTPNGDSYIPDVVVEDINREHGTDFKVKDVIADVTPVDGKEGNVLMETLEERDRKLEELWAEFEEVPMDPDTEQIEDDFLHFPHGTGREEIWHWFDERHSKGVTYLLYSDGVDRTDEHSKLVYLHSLCDECDLKFCRYNHGGECRYAMVHERKPRITEEDGCVDAVLEEHDGSEGV